MNELSTKNRELLNELKNTINNGIKGGIEAGIALKRIRDERLWEEDYDSFEDFCVKEFNFKKSRAYQLIEFSEPKFSTIVEKVENEAQFRAIKNLPEERQTEVIKKAAQSGKVTAESIKKINQLIDAEIIPTDSMGYKIPASCLTVWERSDEAKELLQMISKLRHVLKMAHEKADPLFLELNHNSISSHLSNAQNILKLAVPFAVCTTCNGNASHSCTLCHGRGLLSEFAWNSYVPEEIKAVRLKSIEKSK